MKLLSHKQISYEGFFSYPSLRENNAGHSNAIYRHLQPIDRPYHQTVRNKKETAAAPHRRDQHHRGEEKSHHINREKGKNITITVYNDAGYGWFLQLVYHKIKDKDSTSQNLDPNLF